MTINFGKHKGKDIELLPSSYLKWLAENCNFEDVSQAADNEYHYRTDHNCHFEDD